MIHADRFVVALQQFGFEIFSGTPCSYLTPLMNTVIDAPDVEYIPAANEGDAVAVACGAELGGKRGVALFQNSGLGNAVNPLTSLAWTARIPILLLVSWRGEPRGDADEPQHELMGAITAKLLELMNIPWEILPHNESKLSEVFKRIDSHFCERQTPFALIAQKGTFESRSSLTDTQPSVSHPPIMDLPADSKPTCLEQDDVLRTIQASTEPNDILLATTGYTGRALYALDDRPNQFYMVGSMGCVSSIGLGLAKVRPGKRVIVLDGDGALLMRLGALTMIGTEKPDNLVHILLDNGVHDSTGSQPTVSRMVDLASIAAACGYPDVQQIASLEQLAESLQLKKKGLSFLHVRTLPRTDRKLPRPTVTPVQVTRRLQAWIKEN